MPRGDFRERILAKGWHPRGAYAEKCIRGEWYVQRIVEKHPDHFICCFQRKIDLWAEIEEEYERRQGEMQDSP